MHSRALVLAGADWLPPKVKMKKFDPRMLTGTDSQKLAIAFGMDPLEKLSVMNKALLWKHRLYCYTKVGWIACTCGGVCALA